MQILRLLCKLLIADDFFTRTAHTNERARTSNCDTFNPEYVCNELYVYTLEGRMWPRHRHSTGSLAYSDGNQHHKRKIVCDAGLCCGSAQTHSVRNVIKCVVRTATCGARLEQSGKCHFSIQTHTHIHTDRGGGWRVRLYKEMATATVWQHWTQFSCFTRGAQGKSWIASRG